MDDGTFGISATVKELAAFGKFLSLTEWNRMSAKRVSCHRFQGEFIVGAVDKVLVCVLIPSDAHFAIGIVFQAIVIAIQMVGYDVAQNGDFTGKCIEVVELKTADFNHVDIKGLLCDLSSQGSANIPRQSHVKSGLLKQMVGQ